MNKIDLHGVRHAQVQRTLDVFFWEMINKNASRVEVITGLSQVMKDLVYKVSSDYKFKVSENPLNSGSVFIDLE